MFDLDLALYAFLYRSCAKLGDVFGFGAWEGFIIYAGIITLAVLKGIEISKKVKKC